MLGADLAVLGALGDLALLGALGWVGRGIWPCWARWAGLGVGFGSGGRAGLGWARWAGLGVGFGSGGRAGLCWAQIWLCLARSAGWDLAVLGALGWVGRGVWLWWVRWDGLGVGFGRAGRAAGLGGVWLWWVRCAVLGADLAFCVWSTLYMSSSCLPDVFIFIFMCISNGIMGFEQNKAWHPRMKRGFEQFRVRKM